MNYRRLILLTVLCALAQNSIGCNDLPPGSVESVATRPVLGAPRAGEVYLLRGWRGLWSKGIDELAAELRSVGVDALVFRADQTRQLADALSTRYAGPARPDGPLVLIGFSYGADDAVEIARSLDERGIAVDLLVSIDPVTPPAVPLNVKACRNYYETNGPWDALPWLRGIPLRESPTGAPGRLVNVNVRKGFGTAPASEFTEPGTSHARIASDPKLHKVILAEVMAACPARQHVR